MDITTRKLGDTFVLTLAGRFDASWCDHVKAALDAAVRSGEHRLHLDMAAVNYVSSAGLRVLLNAFKQLKTINGQVGIINGSPVVREVLELAGLAPLLVTSTPVPAQPAAAAASTSRIHSSASAAFEYFNPPDSPPPAATVRLVGDAAALTTGVAGQPLTPVRFDASTWALGVGALGPDAPDAAPRLGELLAIGGLAAYQPADGSNRPDFMITEGALVPEGQLLLGLVGHGLPATLARFTATSDRRTIGLTELAATALELAASPAVVVVALTETAGLVGAALRQSPVAAAPRTARFGFPGVRDWLSFSSERTHRDSTTLVVGLAARPGTPFAPLLRPLAPGSNLLGHFHAAAFPYRPLRKGRLELPPALAELFDGFALQTVLHLLADPREINGAGESEFYRGALWFAPVAP